MIYMCVWDLEHNESAHLTGFNRLERAGELAIQCYSTSQLDYVLSWFMGNPTRGCLFRPLGCASWSKYTASRAISHKPLKAIV